MRRGRGGKDRNIAESYVFAYDLLMKTITASKARANLYRLIEETADSSEPIQITGKRINAVLVSEEDWRAMQETMYLLSIPGMRESIREGMATPLEECSEEIDW
jgi:antitoxin YefM